MSFFKLFSSSLNSAASIPQYKQGEGHDSIDLQIKSLLYIFKRLKIHKLNTFLSKENTLRYNDEINLQTVDEMHEDNHNISEEFEEENEAYYQKLDQMYNIEHFKLILLNDEYRVMVDYIKNKFRSYCIVSDLPSPNLSRPSSPVKSGINYNGISTNNIEDDDYPSFRDGSDKKVKGFRFILLPINDISIEFIANTLSMSDIYYEHFNSFLDFNKRYQYAIDAIHKVIDDDRFINKIKSINITEDEKASIIENYIHSISFNIQLNRIYDEYLKQFPIAKPQPTNTTTTITTNSSPISSPTRTLRKPITTAKPLVNISLNTSPTKSLSKRPSIAELRQSSPTKSPQKQLRTKPSISRIRASDEVTPHINSHNPFLENSSMKSDISAGTVSTVSDEYTSNKTTMELRLDIYDKCRQAIQDKLNRERIKLSL
ncbi:uncharacterized protein RJT21DRAFT_119253 [Scheffersomyces amazonensis]|uniref:uncharacterized protein n=1 Tax=Scheffersomyces amazonensis TaxID=1078765 RepID=UPI00315E01BC